MSRSAARGLFLVPNLLSYARILTTAVVAWALLRGYCEPALWLMIAGGLTDAADGFLARRFGWTSKLGAFLDPIADKFMMTTLFVVFSMAGLAPAWLAGLVIGRDVFILVMIAIAFASTTIRNFPPRLSGKISTVFQMVLTVILAVRCAYPSFRQPWLEPWLWATAVFTVSSGIDYLFFALHTLRKR